MSEHDIEFTREDIDTYLKELAKRFRKLNGTKMPGEIIIVGGAAVLLKYDFRKQSRDIDGIIRASSAIKESINYVADKYNLPRGWLNTDFVKTRSYSPALYSHSKYYKTYSNVLMVRIIEPEFLIAMKLVASRNYKYDFSDIIGILKEQKKEEKPISFEMIKNAVCELYGDYESVIPEESRRFLDGVYKSQNLDELYDKYYKTAMSNKKNLIEFRTQYPGTLNEDNLDEIMQNLQHQQELKQKIHMSLITMILSCKKRELCSLFLVIFIFSKYLQKFKKQIYNIQVDV